MTALLLTYSTYKSLPTPTVFISGRLATSTTSCASTCRMVSPKFCSPPCDAEDSELARAGDPSDAHSRVGVVTPS
eukprot:929393-Pleurochrysis_carterae.AAC.2